MLASQDKKYLIISMIFHLGILLIFILGLDYTSTLPVFENTNQQDVISAVVLGDTEKSNILPKQITAQPPPLQHKTPTNTVTPVHTTPPKALKQKTIPKPQPPQDAIALNKPKNIFGKNLLADIKKQTEKQEKQIKQLEKEKKIKQAIKQKQLQAQFQKTLTDQAEKSLRQQLLNEDIKLQGMQSRQSQGEVNKYKALILQAISEKWIVPTQANKKLYCELMIRTAPGGMVLDVQITQSSGDPSLDSSARAAVLKASPLPVPSKAEEYQPFRQFVLKVKPENIVDNGI